MNLSRFFVSRPIFAGVLALLTFLAGAIALFQLPVSQYPEVVPPTVVVRAVYPGANPQVIAETVASPLEQSINGVENSLYLFSQSTADGVLTLTVTFRIGTDLDTAQVQVQNRVAQALPKLPEEVRRLGVTTVKASPDLTMVVHLTSPDGRYDDIYVRNYATLQVRDVLARIDGIGQVNVFGSGDYSMRVWLDPHQLAARQLTASDVVQAIREQNIQVAAGTIGAQPTSAPQATQLLINTQGRLQDEAEFGQIVLKSADGPGRAQVLLRDVARLEMGANDYALRSLLDNKPAVALPIFQAPGSNAIAISQAVRATMDDLARAFPEGLSYRIAYDPTVFVSSSITAVVHTLLEAIFLVVIVVVLFLQTWRASIIPLAAVPVSLVGTFAAMHALGFSINALSLFGLVLAIGIVVDDAIVVVENVERNIELGLSPRDATDKAMREVTGPIIATALVLAAVFVPTAFVPGLTGRFYQQFAITIAISTVISAFNSLTLSPALSALLLRSHHAPKDRLSVLLERTFGWLFRPFNRLFTWASQRYSHGVARTARRLTLAMIVYAGLVLLSGLAFKSVPAGFVPTQDKQYLISFAQLPEGASLDRTEAVIRRMGEIALADPDVASAIAFPGLSINGFTNSPNSGIVFVTLKSFDERKQDSQSANGIASRLQQQFNQVQDAFIAIFPPPPVNGLGTTGGFKLYIQDRAGLGSDALFAATQDLIAKASQRPELAGLFTSYTVNVPQLYAEVDRAKAKSLGVNLGALFETMQANLGSIYVNDFNRFGRTYQVTVQADAPFRDEASDIGLLQTRNSAGEMLPLSTLVKVRESYGPDRVMRYNGYPASDLSGMPAPGYSSGQAEKALAELAAEVLPSGLYMEWTELTYQKNLAGTAGYLVFPLAVLLVFMVLSAQYESFRLPLAVLLIVPLTLLSAFAGVWWVGGDNNIFTQIGLVVLVGLAAKNAILIVEFAHKKQTEEGLSAFDAAVEASRLRLRPILMTSIAFIAGVYPLVAAQGAGAEMRSAMGVAVFSGMIGVTFFGLFLTPAFYVLLQRRKRPQSSPTDNLPVATAALAHPEV